MMYYGWGLCHEHVWFFVTVLLKANTLLFQEMGEEECLHLHAQIKAQCLLFTDVFTIPCFKYLLGEPSNC